MQSEIKLVSLDSIDANPMRQLKKYPFNKDKIEALRRSIDGVGVWERIIARKRGNRLQAAFGHHLMEAARQEKVAKIHVIVRDLTDEQMLQFMGRENMEDYNANFLVMLETWEAAAAFTARRAGQIVLDIDIARLLGWTRAHKRGDHTTTDVVHACSDASKLIAGGYLNRDDLAGLTVKSVRELCGRIVAQHEQLDQMAKKTNRPAADLERAKKHLGKGGRLTAHDVRQGRVAPKDIRGRVDLHAHGLARKDKKQTPLFELFGKALAEQVEKVAKSDGMAAKFAEVQKSLGMLTMQEDIEVVELLAFQCGNASKRFAKWENVFTNPKRKVVKLEVSRG